MLDSNVVTCYCNKITFSNNFIVELFIFYSNAIVTVSVIYM